MNKTLESLSPIEREIIPFLGKPILAIVKETKLDKTSVIRALGFLENKGLVITETKSSSIINLGVNGIFYKKNHLPERRLIIALEEKSHQIIEDLKNKVNISDNEFKAALGALKRKNIIDLKEGKVILIAKKEEISKKSNEELFIEKMPQPLDILTIEEKKTYEILKSRKDIVETTIQKEISYKLTETGKSIAGKKIELNLIEEVTPELIKEFPRGKQFRRYDLTSNAPKLYGGKVHFVNQSISYAKKIWTDMGFKEMNGSLVQTSFWNFDALYTPQDHPAREMQDTFFIKDVVGKLPDKDLMNKIKKVHEQGLFSGEGWHYNWKEEESKKVVLRTHTTGISARTLAKIAQNKEKEGKYFTIGKNFRNETVDWSHGFEFNQSEGIVIGKDLTFRHLLGYLKEFFRKMGYDEIRFRPSYFPYTEPSVEIEVWHPENKVWFELGGAGMFRPEVTIPLVGEGFRVLAWGPGFDRIIMEYNEIKDLREMYKNDVKVLRNKKMWLK